MPDWSYRTLIRPLLYRLSAETGRDFALEAMGILARLPGGGAVIDFLGHLRPNPQLRRVIAGVEFASPVGLGPALDVHGRALPALERFGFGFLEVGPVMPIPLPPGANMSVERDDERETFRFARPPSLSSSALLQQLQTDGPPCVPLIVRLPPLAHREPAIAAEVQQTVIHKLAPYAKLFSTAPFPSPTACNWTVFEWATYFEELMKRLRAASPNGSMFLVLPVDELTEESTTTIEAALQNGAAGLIVDGAIVAESGETEVGGPARLPAVRLVRELRSRLGPEVPIIAAGGVHQPLHALDLLEAGADLIEIDAGLVFSGPGLPKRVNEAIRSVEAARVSTAATADTPPTMTVEPLRAVDSAWLWALLLGVGLLIGGTIAVAIASTRVVLPYDEMLTGLNREQLRAINEQLLPFMAHDRVSVAGTMLAVGIFYCGLAWYGIRRGAHWAFIAVMASSVIGFVTFFTFLGFGYFDPFHAFVTTIMFQLQLMAIRGRMVPEAPVTVPDLVDDRAWRTSQWGQLVWIVHACGLMGAGGTILFIACSFVFVETDLDFLCTTAEALWGAHPRVVGLVAHDRAAFGGMLMAAGVTMLLSSLWGFARGRRWLWWTLVVGSLPGYAAALIVHIVVGYSDWLHLTPVSLGLAATVVGAALSRAYLCETAPSSGR